MQADFLFFLSAGNVTCESITSGVLDQVLAVQTDDGGQVICFE
jgi:hypothetical protein